MTTAQPPRTALITGATAGIGLAIAHDLCRAGANIVINGRRPEKLDEVCAVLNANHTNHRKRAVSVVGDCA